MICSMTAASPPRSHGRANSSHAPRSPRGILAGRDRAVRRIGLNVTNSEILAHAGRAGSQARVLCRARVLPTSCGCGPLTLPCLPPSLSKPSAQALMTGVLRAPQFRPPTHHTHRAIPTAGASRTSTISVRLGHRQQYLRGLARTIINADDECVDRARHRDQALPPRAVPGTFARASNVARTLSMISG